MMSIFSNRLEQMRNKKGWTKTYTSKKLGIALTTYANYEYGEREPDFEMLTQIAKLFDTTTDYLIGKTDNPNPVSTNNISETDLDELLDNARSYDGKKMDDHDRDLIRNYLKGLFDAKS